MTEIDIAKTFVELGVPKEDIVLGLQPGEVMTESTQQILQAALTLPPAERMRLIDRRVASLDRSDRDLDKPRSSQRNIMELKGLGKEIWQGLDAQEYVNQERALWNG